MTNYREILRLHSLGLNKTEIAASMGCSISAFQIMRFLFYPYLLLISSLIAIYVIGDKKK